MQKIVQFDGTDTGKEQVKQDNSSLYLIEERDWFDDETTTTRVHYLIFSDTKPIKTQLQEQADNQLTIMEAIADLYSALPTTT